MRRLTERVNAGGEVSGTLTLPFDLRQRSRLRARLDSGEEVAVTLSRGTVLRGGDMLCADEILCCSVGVSHYWGESSTVTAHPLDNRLNIMLFLSEAGCVLAPTRIAMLTKNPISPSVSTRLRPAMGEPTLISSCPV